MLLVDSLSVTSVLLDVLKQKVPTDVILVNDLAVVEMERRKEN